MKTLVVIPVYNESETLKVVLEKVAKYVDGIVLVDDGSQPSMKSLAKGHDVFYLRHKINLGQGAALDTGTRFALSQGADLIIHMDADDQHDSAYIPAMIQQMKDTDTDIIIGSRFLDKEVQSNIPALRKFILKGAVYLNFITTGVKMTDAHNGFRIMNKKAASVMRFTENRMAYATEILDIIRRNKLKVGEIAQKVKYTDYSLEKGQKNINAVNILFDIISKKIFR